MSIVAYVDGKELTANELALTCELSSNKWSINFEKMSEILDKINLYFKVYYEFIAPVDGTYRLETLGAQGGRGHLNGKIYTNAAYGGFGGNIEHVHGAGDSGYIGSSLLKNKAMYCYNCTESTDENTKTISTTCHNATTTANCAKEGNGYAKITYLNY